MEDINNIANMSEENKQEIFIADGVANNSFVKESGVKIFILTLLFGIFYPIGYFYKQWKAIKKNNEEYKNISPFWRGVFYPIYAFNLMGIIRKLLAVKKEKDLQNCQNEEEKKKIEKKYKSNIILTYALPLGLFGVILSTLGKMLVQRTDWPIYAIIIFIVLYCSQTIINCVLPKNHAKGKITFADFLGVFPWILYMLLSLMIYLSSIPYRIQVEDNKIINTLHNYSFTFPIENQEVRINPEEYLYCQNETEDSEFCMQWLIKDDPSLEKTFEKVLEETLSVEALSLVKRWSQTYAGNTAYCAHFKTSEDVPYTFCLLQTSREKYIWTWFVYTDNEDITNLEKLMNSYKTW